MGIDLEARLEGAIDYIIDSDLLEALEERYYETLVEHWLETRSCGLDNTLRVEGE
jgi:hypothetical protein